MIRSCVLVCSGLMVASASQAAFFSGPATFTWGPTTQLGTITGSSLTITNLVNGFDVSGQVTISVPSGYQAGTLLQWTVDRPLDPAYLPAINPLMSTTTNLTGYSLPPVGTFGPTSGHSSTAFNLYPVSQSTIPLTLVNGAATWSASSTSSTFTYTTGGLQYVRQVFDLDGVQLTGPGGNWIVDFPVSTIVNGVPEPTTMLLLAGGLATVVRRRRR